MRGLLMFVDTETTGLSRFDRIVQIAWQLYAKDSKSLVSSSCFIVKPTDFKIGYHASKIHGITQKIAYEKGLERALILEKFQRALKRSDLVVAHNMNFDDRMISSELNRLKNDNLITLWTEKRKMCTMKELRRFYGKNLKLADAYVRLTGQCIPENIHSADVDTEMLAKIYFVWEKRFRLDANVKRDDGIAAAVA